MSTELITSTPISAFLNIYLKANKECYINYMEGAKALAKFLAPISFPDIYEVGFPKIPKFYSGAYETIELIKILSKNPYDLKERSEKEAAIFYALTKQMPKDFNIKTYSAPLKKFEGLL